MNWDTSITIISAPPLRKDLDILRQPFNAEQPSLSLLQNTFCIYQTTFCRTALRQNSRFFVFQNFKTKSMEQKNTKQTKKVFTTKFNYSMPTEELKKIMPAVAPGFSTIPGCCWKIWLINEDRKEAGGVYLFESA